MAVGWSEHKKWVRGTTRPTYLPLLIGERVYMYTNMFFAFFATVCISNGKFCIFHFGDPQIKKSKKRKFQNALKYDLNEFWYRFRVRRCPKTSKEPISSNITSFWANSANVWKIEFSSELTFLMILSFWALLTIWPIIWPEVSKNMFGGRKWPLETFKSIAHTVDDVFWWLEQILKNDEKSSFLSIFLL